MEVGRRPDNVPIRWESNGNPVSLKKVAKTSECVKTSVQPIHLPENDLHSPDSTDASLHQLKDRQVTPTSDVIDQLLEAFQNKWMALRLNKRRVQSATIWRNGNIIYSSLKKLIKHSCLIFKRK